jgi:hypothetical protein
MVYLLKASPLPFLQAQDDSLQPIGLLYFHYKQIVGWVHSQSTINAEGQSPEGCETR